MAVEEIWIVGGGIAGATIAYELARRAFVCRSSSVDP